MRARRRQSGSASVEFTLIIPVVIVLIAGIGWFRKGYETELQTLHSAETETWKVAMTNDRGTCGTSERHRFAGIELGAAGDRARETAANEMSDWSFLYVNGGVRKDVTRAIPSPMRPLEGSRWSSTTRSDYLPCNETIGSDDGELAGGFDAIWKEYATP